jgi:hypothetical protein
MLFFKKVGKIKIPEKVKLIVGMLSQNLELFSSAEKELEKKFSEIDYRSNLLPFSHTDYYEKEMGKNLLRKFISFKKLIFPEEIVEIKIFTNELEEKFSFEGKRKINLDPGYLTLSKLVLVSTKDYSHRVYLNKGIYAEATLFYKDKKFQNFPYTYPDYRTEEYKKIFQEIRNIYYKQFIKSDKNEKN